MNMNESKNILTQINHKDGLTVPEGYFDDFATKMVNALPHRDEAESPDTIILPTPNLWTRIRPYVYMAAMFAGIWCMLKMFSLMASPGDEASHIDRNPILAEALRSDVFINDYVIDDVHQLDIIDDMIEDGFDLTMLDFDSDSDREVSFIDPAAVNITD